MGVYSEHSAAVICQGLSSKTGDFRISYTKLCYLGVWGVSTEPSNCTNGELRLYGAVTTNQGRLEVCVNGAWGSVCDSQGVFTTNEAKVACRKLGKLQVEGIIQISCEYEQNRRFTFLDEVGVLDASAFGNPSGPIFLDKIQCSSEEDDLLHCDNTVVHMCTHQQDVGIICHREYFQTQLKTHVT